MDRSELLGGWAVFKTRPSPRKKGAQFARLEPSKRKDQLWRYENGIYPKWAKSVFLIAFGEMGTEYCTVAEAHFTRREDAESCRKIMLTARERFIERLHLPKRLKKSIRLYWKKL